MENQPPPNPPDASKMKVPEELLQKSHEANQHFHDAKSHLDNAIEGTDYRHQERIDQASDKIRAAEREIEEIDQKIHQSIHIPKAD